MKQILLILVGSASLQALAETRYPTNETINTEGRRLYIANCIRCHNVDPRKAGAIGPELFTTPLEVFRTKVPKGTYPSGYKPKRRSKIMPKFPSLADKVDFIYNYIQSTKHDKNKRR